MSKHIDQPTEIEACGNKPKIIKEFIGCVNSQTNDLSIAKMDSPQGWKEPGQTPDFDEYTVVLEGVLHVRTKTEEFDIKESQAFIASKGQWVQYSSPYEGGLNISLSAYLHLHRRAFIAIDGVIKCLNDLKDI